MTGKVAIITGGSKGIGAGLVAGYRRRGWAVVASARTVKPSEDPDVLIVEGDIAQPGSTDRVIDAALERFGRIDTLVNNAGVFISKPFTDYTATDYATVVGVNVTGFFRLTQRAIAEMLTRGGGQVGHRPQAVLPMRHRRTTPAEDPLDAARTRRANMQSKPRRAKRARRGRCAHSTANNPILERVLRPLELRRAA
jgi:hypothetical protein